MYKRIEKNIKKIIIVYTIFFSFMFLLKVIGKDYTVVVTESLPKGIYKLTPATNLKIGDIVQLQPEEELLHFLHQRKYLPDYAKTLVKEIAADYSNRNSIHIKETGLGTMLYVEGKNYGLLLNRDSNGREVFPKNLEEMIPKTEEDYLLLTPAFKSYDGRYFGTIKKERILKKAKIIIKF